MIARLNDSVRRDPWLWATGLLAAVLLAYLNLHDARLFASLTMNRTIPDSDLQASPASLLALRDYLATRPEAADVLRSMHLYPDLLLPAVLTTFLALLIRRLTPGAVVFRRPAEMLLPGFLVIPLVYGLADYVENAVSLMFFPPATPTTALAGTLAVLLFWATRVKFLAATVAALIILRLIMARSTTP